MIVPDLNLLVYAIDESAQEHHRALGWWEALLSGTETVGLTWVVLLGFVRITTNPRVMAHGARLHSADHDFGRFAGLDWVDPLAA